MIEDASSMDRTLEKRRGIGLKTLGSVLLLLLVAASLFFLYPSMTRWLAAERSVAFSRIRVGTVTRGDLLRDVSVQGKIIAADQPTLLSPAQGIITIVVRAGDPVKRGDTLARIESPELQNQLQQEKSTLLSMTSDMERQKIAGEQAHQENLQQIALLELTLQANQRAMERASSLRQEGLGNTIDFERARDEVEISRLELTHSREKTRLEREASDFEIRNRELQLERQALVVQDVERRVQELSIVSPVNGLVSRVDVQDKDTVQPNQTLLSVVDLSKFQVEVLIPENFADEIGIGMDAVIGFGNQEYKGRVRSVSPEVESSQVKGVVEFIQDPPSGLRQNQRVDTRLILDSRSDVLKVPRGPFLESMGGRQVYVVRQGMAELRPISVGSISVTEVEITSGLREGEEIVLSDLTRFEGSEKIMLR